MREVRNGLLAFRDHGRTIVLNLMIHPHEINHRNLNRMLMDGFNPRPATPREMIPGTVLFSGPDLPTLLIH